MGATLGLAPAAQALTYEVDNLGDSGAATTCDAGTDNDCSLRQAIDNSNGSGVVDDVIVFEAGLSGSIALGTGITIFDTVEINGPGAAAVTLDGNDTTNHLYIAAAAGDVDISGLTFFDGAVTGDGAAINNGDVSGTLTVSDTTLSSNRAFNGGAIYSLGPVTITDSRLTDNLTTTASGGAIFLAGSSADLIVRGSELSGNMAPMAFGGAIYSPSGADVDIENSTLSGNTAETVGGVGVQGGELTITGSTVSGNASTDFDGGGVRVTDADASITRSTISGNTANRGGGVAIDQGSVEIENSTISGNEVVNSGKGGGIHFVASSVLDTLTISNSTISGNRAAGPGGGAYFSDLGPPAPDPQLSNAIVAGNSAPSAPDLFGTWDASFSLIESAAGATVGSPVPGSNLIGVDPRLGPLAANGGSTRTHLPAPNSPAIDRGSTSASTDQRGNPRPLDIAAIGNAGAAGADGADIGAVELTRAEAKLCGGRQPTIVATGRKVRGTAKADVILGTSRKNVIRGRGGRDRLCGLGGPDTLIGGRGRDTLIGGPGADTLKGGPGRDKLRGGPGRDIQRQ